MLPHPRTLAPISYRPITLCILTLCGKVTKARHLTQDYVPAVGRFSLQDTARASLTDARQQARELQEQLRGRLGTVYLEQCRTVAPDFRARGRRCDWTSCPVRQWSAVAAIRKPG